MPARAQAKARFENARVTRARSRPLPGVSTKMNGRYMTSNSISDEPDALLSLASVLSNARQAQIANNASRAGDTARTPDSAPITSST